MKNSLALLSFLLLFSVRSMSQTITTEHHYVQVGESLTFTDTNNTWDVTETNLRDYARLTNSGSKFTITGLVVGTVPFYTAQKNGYTVTKQTTHVIHIVDVQEISLSTSLELTSGESFTFTPLVTPLKASTTFTWTSSNAAVAIVNTNGIVTAKGVGKAIITCTASNGIMAQSLITVSPLLVQSVALDRQACDLSVGESIRLQSVILPINATSSDIKWLSSNENIAQVDDVGNVIAISSGYCSIFAIADDGSGKYDKCLIHVSGGTEKGDMNNDGKITITDAVVIVDMIISGSASAKKRIMEEEALDP